jgi:SnoaL-like protein
MRRVSTRLASYLMVAISSMACNDTPVDASAVGPLPNSGDASVNNSPVDRAAIQQIVSTFDQNWGVNAVAYAAQYADADFVGPTGANLTTAAQILQLYTAIFPAFAGTTRQSEIRALTFLTGTVAVLDIDTRLTGALPPFVTPWQPGIVRALEKNVLVKRGGEWRIVQHQQTLVAPGIP